MSSDIDKVKKKVHTETKVPVKVAFYIMGSALGVKPWCKNVATAFDKEIKEFHSHNYPYYFGTDIPPDLWEQSRDCYKGKCPCFTNVNSSKESSTTLSEKLDAVADKFLGKVKK